MNRPFNPDFGGDIRPDFVPASDYEGPHVTALEKTRLWPKIWHIACREEDIPNVGDFYNYEIYDESILVTRTKKDEIKAFYNVCQHRGRRLRDDERGNVAQGFYCRFHGWRYGLDGKVTYIHDRKDWDNCPGFKSRDLNLKQPKVGFWAGWIWLNMDPDAPDLIEWLDAIVPRMKNFEIEKMKYAWHETIIAPVNWKVIMEAFNEGYHSGATHNSLIDYKTMESPGHVHGRNTMYYTQFAQPTATKREDGQWHPSKTIQEHLYYQAAEIHDTLFALIMDPMMNAMTRWKNETSADEPMGPLFTKLWNMHREEMEKAGLLWPENLTEAESANAGTGWHIFPNTIMLPSIDGVLWYRMRPYGDDPNKCMFDIWCLRPYKPGTEPKVERHISHGFKEFRGRNAFLEQDFDNMEATNKGMKSRGWLGAVTNPHQEVQINHFHKVLREYLYGKSESIAAPMSVGTKPTKKARKAPVAKAKKTVSAKSKKKTKR